MREKGSGDEGFDAAHLNNRISGTRPPVAVVAIPIPLTPAAFHRHAAAAAAANPTGKGLVLASVGLSLL